MPTVQRFRNQNYDQLKKQAQTTQTPFTDPEFPAEYSSIYPSPDKKDSAIDIEWKRPNELVQSPHLFVDGGDSDDVIQGNLLSNCWFAAALATVAKNKKLLDQLIPNIRQQEYPKHSLTTPAHEENAAAQALQHPGIFKFRFWRMGSWWEVVVDDRLPTSDGNLTFIHSREKTEFWSALVEKAYAKFTGCYGNLKTGNTGEVLVDFTGGVCETIKLDGTKLPPKEEEILGLKLLEAQEMHALIVASIFSQDGSQQDMQEGLIIGQTYSITRIHDMRLSRGLFSIFNRERMLMIRARNPWGQGEWKGAWSDESEQWNNIPKQEKDDMGFVIDDDGEFWMDFSDFIQYFSSIHICMVLNTNVFNFLHKWKEHSAAGVWHVRTSGGAFKVHDDHFSNPQYLLTVPYRKGKEDPFHLVLHLSQDPILMTDAQNPTLSSVSEEAPLVETKAKPQMGCLEFFNIGITLFNVEYNREYKIHSAIDSVKKPTFTKERHAFERFTLKEGQYVIIPTTAEPGQAANYYLRAFTSGKIHFRELTMHHPIGKWYRCIPTPHFAVKVELERCDKLATMDQIGGADPYCILTVGHQKTTSPIRWDTLNPLFSTPFIFYTTNRTDRVLIRVYNKNIVKDDFMGQLLLPAATPEAQRYCQPLTLKNGTTPNNLGNITVVVTLFDDLRRI